MGCTRTSTWPASAPSSSANPVIAAATSSAEPSPTRTRPRSLLCSTSGSETLTTTGQPSDSAAATASAAPCAGRPDLVDAVRRQQRGRVASAGNHSGRATAAGEPFGRPRPGGGACGSASAGGASSAVTRRHAAYRMARASARTAAHGGAVDGDAGCRVLATEVGRDHDDRLAAAGRPDGDGLAELARVGQGRGYERHDDRVDLVGLQQRPHGASTAGRGVTSAPTSTGLPRRPASRRSAATPATRATAEGRSGPRPRPGWPRASPCRLRC